MKFISLQVMLFRMFGASVNEGRSYIDPGTGSMLLQVILGGIAGAAVAVKMFWHRIVAFLPARGSDSSDSTPIDN